MDGVERILRHDCVDHDRLVEWVGELTDETGLWRLMSGYNWNDGFAIPLAVVRHPRCDRGLALRMYWELDDAARIHHGDDRDGLREAYSTMATYEPSEFDRLVEYCTVLVRGLRDESFPVGRNSFDTGFFGFDDPSLTDRRRRLRIARTKAARRDLEDGFLRPVTAE